MQILLTNDDGIMAEGLWALHDCLSSRFAVKVVAPERERSAVGHGITLHKPLRTSQVELNGRKGLAVSGTPADCVKLGVVELLGARPDLVVAGINPGANVGLNLNYSGTVSAAREAAMYGLPAIAISHASGPLIFYQDAADFTARLVETICAEGMPKGTFLNVNYPSLPLSEVAGVKISRQGTAIFPEYFDKRTDLRQRTYYWQGCDASSDCKDMQTDGAAICQGYISITPVKCDMTDQDFLVTLKGWDFSNGFKSR